LGYGITAAWVGAPISGLSADIAAGITYKIPTAAAVKNYISGLCFGNTAGGAVSSVSGSGNGVLVSPTTGAVVVSNTGVHSFNGLTGAVTGVTVGGANTFTALNTFNAGISASGSTFSGNISAPNIVTSFNGATGAVQGVSAAVAGTGISVSGATGAVTITNIGVQSFNGNTGAVTGASLGANTFTGTQTLTAGLTTSYLYASTGSTFASTLQVNGGATFSGRTDFAGNNNFATGLSAAGTLNTTGSIKFNGTTAKTITTTQAPLTITGTTSGAVLLASTNSIVFGVQTDDPLKLYSATGVVEINLDNYVLGSPYTTGIKIFTGDVSETVASVNISPLTYFTADRTLNIQDASGTIALTSQLMGTVNGSTAATTAVTSFNGRTGAVQGVSAAAAGDGIAVSGATGAVTITNTGVTRAVAGTGISVSGATGSVTITNIGVQSFNGNTGAVTGASLGANTFTGLNTFNAGITTAFIYASTGSTFGGTLKVVGGATFDGRVYVGGNLYAYGDFNSNGDAQFERVVTVLGGATFNATAQFTNGLTSSGSIQFKGTTQKYIRSTQAPIFIQGVSSGVVFSYNSISLPVDNTALSLGSVSGNVNIVNNATGAAIPGLRILTDDQDFIGSFGTVIKPISYATAERTQTLQDASGTIALTSQLMGTVNGSTAATTAVTSFNGLTGAVQGVSAAVAGTGISVSGATGAVTITNTGVTRAVAGTGISVSGATGSVTITNIGVQSFNGNTGAVQGVSAAVGSTYLTVSGSTGSVTFTNTGVQTFNGLTGAVQGVSAAVAGTGISVSGATGAVTITNIGVQSFNGLTGAVTGVTVGGANTFTALNTFNAGLSASAVYVSTGSTFAGLVTFTNGVSAAGTITLASPNLTGTPTAPTAVVGTNTTQIATTAFVQSEIVADTVTAFNGRTGAVQGVSAAVAGTGISVSGATGAVTITNTGVQTFNGLTGAVTGVTVGGANTFTALNSFNAGISASTLTVAGGVTFSGNVYLGDAATGVTADSNDVVNILGGTSYKSGFYQTYKLLAQNTSGVICVTPPLNNLASTASNTLEITIQYTNLIAGPSNSLPFVHKLLVPIAYLYNDTLLLGNYTESIVRYDSTYTPLSFTLSTSGDSRVTISTTTFFNNGKFYSNFGFRTTVQVH
jgi:hypothetical protein